MSKETTILMSRFLSMIEELSQPEAYSWDRKKKNYHLME